MSNNVLLVEDETGVRELFTELLTKERYKVNSVASGEEALEAVKEGGYDIVLLDIKLPGINGLEVLKRIKESNPGLIVIMITGFGYDEELVAKSKEYGCSGYIGKNMQVSQFINSFKTFIKSAREKDGQK